MTVGCGIQKRQRARLRSGRSWVWLWGTQSESSTRGFAPGADSRSAVEAFKKIDGPAVVDGQKSIGAGLEVAEGRGDRAPAWSCSHRALSGSTLRRLS